MGRRRTVIRCFGLSWRMLESGGVNLKCAVRGDNGGVERYRNTMKITVLFASNSHGGKHEEIKNMIQSLRLPHEFDFIELADQQITHCRHDCPNCVIRSEYRCLDGDDTFQLQDRLCKADMNLIIVPRYYPYPSKFTALMEKMLNACLRTANRPLKDKPTAIFLYCSSKIDDETQLKILWQQFLMDEGYSFYEVNYPFLNESYHDELNDRFHKSIVAYIRSFLLALE